MIVATLKNSFQEVSICPRFPRLPSKTNSKMSSSAASWRTPSPSSSSGSEPRFEVFKMKSKPAQKHNPPPKQKKNKKPMSGNLWGPVKGWLPFYRCTACHQVMSRKEPPKYAQRIYSCGHIVCAGCIARSYLIELNPLCPCEGCGKQVNPHAEPIPAPATARPVTPPPKTCDYCTLPEEKCKCYEDEGCRQCGYSDHCICSGIDNTCSGCGSDGRCYCDEEPEYTHYCGDEDCRGDCGVLVCGCIDVCRGRCGSGGWYSGW